MLWCDFVADFLLFRIEIISIVRVWCLAVNCKPQTLTIEIIRTLNI